MLGLGLPDRRGFCADGVCCNAACDAGPCDACSVAAGAAVDGTCALLTGPVCDDGNACTQTDTCQAGVCTGGNPVTCAAQDECHEAGTCDASSGQCSNPTKPDGTACSTGSSSSGDAASDGGCGCRTAGGDESPNMAWLGAVGLTLAAARRRRKMCSDT